MFFIIYCFQGEAYDYYWCLLGFGGDDIEHSCISAYNIDNLVEAADGSYIVKLKVHMKYLSWMKVSCVQSCTFMRKCHLSIYQIVNCAAFVFFRKFHISLQRTYVSEHVDTGEHVGVWSSVQLVTGILSYACLYVVVVVFK